MISIDEQIHYQKQTVALAESRGFDAAPEKAILASLERLKAIDSVQVPDEPMHVDFTRRSLQYAPPPTTASVRSYRQDKELIEYIDTLLDFLKRESARADDLQKLHENKYTLLTGNALAHMKQRAEAAESKLAAMLKLGAEPSEEMCDVGAQYVSERFIFKEMFAKHIRAAEGK